MTVQFPPLAPSLPGDLPTPADAIRADGWTPARRPIFSPAPFAGRRR